MDYFKITINCTDEEAQSILVATLSDEGYEGFEQQTDVLIAFIPCPDFDQEILTELIGSLPFTKTLVPSQNWNEEWERNFEPVIIENLVGIRAHFHAPITSVMQEIVITPKMSFGTGHHATTRLMIVLMNDLDFNNKFVLDFGTGTGVLAILAEKQGAKRVLAVDNEEWALLNANENVTQNGCHNIDIEGPEHIFDQDRRYDCILANINRHVLLQNMKGIHDSLADNGTILMSGLLEEDKEIITASAENEGLTVKYIIGLNNWIALALGKVPQQIVKGV